MAPKERKPGDMKHTETNKSESFAYCCILMRWLRESVLDVVDHDGEIEMDDGEGGDGREWKMKSVRGECQRSRGTE